MSTNIQQGGAKLALILLITILLLLSHPSSYAETNTLSFPCYKCSQVEYRIINYTSKIFSIKRATITSGSFFLQLWQHSISPLSTATNEAVYITYNGDSSNPATAISYHTNESFWKTNHEFNIETTKNQGDFIFRVTHNLITLRIRSIAYQISEHKIGMLVEISE